LFVILSNALDCNLQIGAGSFVRVRGLITNTNYNGAEGVVTGLMPLRYRVRLETGVNINVLLENMELIQTANSEDVRIMKFS
jgi:hypothetical protein